MAPGSNTGTVKWFDPIKCFGFIVRDDCDADIFVHVSQLVDQQDTLETGDRVSFIIDTGRDGRPCARRIVVLRG
jgi:cold shock protein